MFRLCNGISPSLFQCCLSFLFRQCGIGSGLFDLCFSICLCLDRFSLSFLSCCELLNGYVQFFLSRCLCDSRLSVKEFLGSNGLVFLSCCEILRGCNLSLCDFGFSVKDFLSSESISK